MKVKSSNTLGSPLRGDNSPSGGAKLRYVTWRDTNAADAYTDRSTDGREGWNSYVDTTYYMSRLIKLKSARENALANQKTAIFMYVDK